MRVMELALQRWCYSKFLVMEGYPVPVVFATPMDAWGSFVRLWKLADNPFSYLLRAVDGNGTPLYRPYPSAPMYPLISISRQSMRLRQNQNFSIHRFRHVNWPTVSDTGTIPLASRNQTGIDLLRCDLGNVTTSRMPLAFDFRFQVDHFCLRPDTQAFFIEKLVTQFWRGQAGMQSWMSVCFVGGVPGYVRIWIDGDVDNAAPEEGGLEDKNVTFKTSFTLVVEGFSVDVDYKIQPALWYVKSSSATPQQLDSMFSPPIFLDLRTGATNEVTQSRLNVPSSGTCAQAMLRSDQQASLMVWFGDPNAPRGFVPVWPPFTPAFDYSIASTLAFGSLSVTQS